MKKNCHNRMMRFVYNKVKEDMERKKNKKEENGMKRMGKKEVREL